MDKRNPLEIIKMKMEINSHWEAQARQDSQMRIQDTYTIVVLMEIKIHYKYQS
jgi:hypothetical protein